MVGLRYKIREVTMNYKVSFIGYGAEYKRLEKEIDSAIKEALSKGDLILRQQVRNFEDSVASFLGASRQRYPAVATLAGWCALFKLCQS